jgi:hypothetical protein
MIERWCQVKGYEGLYEVSNLGRVKSVWGDVSCAKLAEMLGLGHTVVWMIQSGKRWAHVK